MKKNPVSRRITILRDSVALRIAAGEVIERPYSIVRELLDNAIDSGASAVDVYIEKGGLDSIRVIDNGNGMEPEDLKICFFPHSTSKITEIEDLDSLATLGFRGEALASIASCAHLEVTSSPTGEEAFKISVQDSRYNGLSPAKGKKGTLVTVSKLFYSLPARKKFLKRSSSEALLCKKMFIEKALPFNTIAFRYYQDRELKLFFPASTLKERILNAYPGILHKDLIHEMNKEYDSFSLTIIAADPSLSRKDRRYIQIFINNRRISDFSLVQAVEYGFSEFLPGGNYPLAFIFITINASLIDFNIHPTKKEVRIKNTAEIHHAIVTTLKNHLQRQGNGFRKTTPPSFPENRTFSAFDSSGQYHNNQPKIHFSLPSLVREFPPSYQEETGQRNRNDSLPFQYIGQIFNLFLVVEKGEEIFFIDQHASHEKILFNEFLEKQETIQELLVPLIFTVEKEIDSRIDHSNTAYRNMGILLERISENEWALKGIPEKCIGQEHTIVNFIRKQSGTVKDLKTALYADMACKTAIKDGEVLDSVTAVELIKKVFALKNARCPHGRPLWFQISRDELFKQVGRT